MRRLIGFELKKMLSRRVALATNVGVLLLLAFVMTLNVVQQRTTNNRYETLSGMDAIAQAREVRKEHEGILTTERIAELMDDYRELAYAKLDPAELVGMSDMAVWELVDQTYDDAHKAEMENPCFAMLFSPWKVPGLTLAQYASLVGPEDAAGFYDAVAAMTQDVLDDGQGGAWTYSPAERAYWTQMEASVAEPLAYGYAGGWEDILNCFAFLTLASFAVCVTLTPVFTSEYREGTDAVLLASRYGRSRLVAAKLVASFVYATAYFALAAAIICGVALAFFGTEGFSLPLQNFALAIPYPLSMGQAALLCVGLMYLATIGMAALTLALSARLRSTLAILVTDIVLLFVVGLVPSGGSGVLAHLLALFPMGFQSPGTLFAAMYSYELGPVVVDLVGMIVAVYVLLAAVCVPVAAVGFRRHQVS